MNGHIEVKITGDGAPISRVTSVILLSFSLPSVRDDLSSDGVHTFAAIEGAEGYELFKEGFEPVLCEINNLIDTGSVEIDGKTYPLTIYFGGDYKVNILTF